MKVTETHALLKVIASFVPSYDTKDENRVRAWNRVLGPNMSFDDAEKYMYKHFERSRYAPMPADILELYRNDFDPDKIKPISMPDDMGG